MAPSSRLHSLAGPTRPHPRRELRATGKPPWCGTVGHLARTPLFLLLWLPSRHRTLSRPQVPRGRLVAPITGVLRRVSFPPGLGDGEHNLIRSAALVCSAGDEQHIYGDCHLSPFKLVFACQNAKATHAFVCIYESKSGVWGDTMSTTTTYPISRFRPSILVGNALCWLLDGGDILEFDVETQTLVVIDKPADAHATDSFVDWSFQILRGEDNCLGLAVLSSSKLSIQLWARKPNCDGVVSWGLQNTVQLDELFSRPLSPCVVKLVMMLGYDEDTNVIFLSSFSHDFMLQLESMQFSYIGRREYKGFRMYYPYTHFYTAVRGAAGGDGGAENVNT